MSPTVILCCWTGNLFHLEKAVIDEKSAVVVAKRRTARMLQGISMVRTYPITLILLLSLFRILSVDS